MYVEHGSALLQNYLDVVSCTCVNSVELAGFGECCCLK